ncbi:DUF3568 family protein [Desulfocurvus sp.]|jgi:hypothetical protein|uniref:DUF3568 family protein n=1 Tax=Desulfocurvus sp. TaxID=2871698 RepID=UPI0025B81466|nr:DUF3568 family protein [Desulfocurvus sp.]MCK9240870.1 DUF3568 domain-containing protein [Desulfocurvus sp.]
MKKQFATLVLGFAALAALSGCMVVAAGALAGGGTYAYVSGWGEQTYNVDVADAYDASLRACSALGLYVEEKSRSLSDASVSAKDGDTPVWIKMKSLNPKVTQVRIRVGYLGDEPATQRVHQALRNQL